MTAPNFTPSYLSTEILDYLKILDQSPYCILISTMNHEVKYANTRGKEYFGWTDDVMNNFTLDTLHQKNPSKWSKSKSEIIQNGQCCFQGKCKKINGDIFDVDVICKKITFGDNPSVITFLLDISGQKMLERELVEEQNMRQMILDSIPALVFVKDKSNKIISFNKTYEEITGLHLDFIAGKNVIDIIENKQLAEEYWKDDLEVIETGLPKRNIIEPMITDQTKWFITDKIPYRDHDGKITGVIGFSVDITERKNAEDALVRSEKKFRLLFDTSPDGIVISDLNGNFLIANRAFQNLIEYSDDEIQKLTFEDITPHLNDAIETGFIKDNLLNYGNSETFEKDYIAKSGKIIPVRITCWIIYNELGNPIQLGAYTKDLTYEKKAAELEKSLLQKEKEQLEKDLQTKTQELNSKITQLIEKHGLVNHVIHQLEKLRDSLPHGLESGIRSIITDLNNNTNEDFWIQFETTFGQINQSFYDNIYRAYPSLTNNERKISAFLKMNLSTKDIANITHQTIRSIEMARSRLRKKLNLGRDENLVKFFNQF